MKKFLLLFAMALMTLGAMAQNNLITYQAVVRDANNRLVTNQEITVTIQVLDASNNVQYTETDNVNSNANGLISLLVGDGNPTEFAAINWNGAKFKTTVQVNSTGYEVVSTTPVTSVPMALYANDVNPMGPTIIAVYNKIQQDSLILADRIHTDSLALVNRIVSDSAALQANIDTTSQHVRAALVDTAAAIRGSVPITVAQLADADDYLKASELCSTIESNCTNVALKNGNNDFTGTNTVPQAVDPTTLAYTSDEMQVVSYKDLMMVFDSTVRLLNGNIDKLAKGYDLMIDSLNDVIAELSFRCGVSKVKDVDGNLYNTILLAGKCWMRENLRTTHYPNGEEIVLGEIVGSGGYDAPEFAECDNIPRRYTPGGDEANVDTYGYLYNWTAAMNNAASSDANPSGVRGICPRHWHLPSDAEWTQFMDSIKANPEYVCTGPSYSENNWIAKALASTTGWVLDPEPTSGCSTTDDMENNNKTGFTVLPAGVFKNENNYSLGHESHFWSSTQSPQFPNAAWEYSMFSNGEVVSRANSYKYYGFSVRCVREMSDVILPTYSSLTYTGSAQDLVTPGTSEYGTFTYSTTQNGTYSTAVPQGTDAGNYTVWYKFTGDANHADIQATEITGVHIAQAAGSLSYTAAIVSKETTDNTPFINELTHVGDGVVSFARSSGDDICTVDPTTGEVTLNGTVGTCIITATVTDGTNYTYPTPTGSYTLKVAAAKLSYIDGKFTINGDGHQVYFSMGNLQYIKSTSTWSFMEQQYYTVEKAALDVGDDYASKDTVSLFGWGTSGYNHGATCYQPWSTNNTAANYWAYQNSGYHLYNSTGKADWGYNAISNGGNTENSWRTLTKDEWTYVVNTRTTTTTNLPTATNSDAARYTQATIGGVYKGLILFPDNYAHPDGTYFAVGTYNSNSNYTSTVSLEGWALMESAGCVFLPAAGTRQGKTVNNYVGYYGYYWSSSYVNDINASQLIFRHDKTVQTTNSVNRSNGCSVRLVKDL